MATFKVKEQYGPRGELVFVEVKADYMVVSNGDLQLWKGDPEDEQLVYVAGSCKWVSCERVEEGA